MRRFSAACTHTLLLPLLALGMAAIFSSSDVRAEGDSSSSTAPNFKAKGIDGETYELAELLKKGPVYLDFWTTWCKPCMIALPELQKLHEKYGEQGFTLLTVASDDQKTISKVKPLVKQKKFKFPVIADPKREIGNLYAVRNYPTSYMIGMDGRIAKSHIGYRPGDEKSIEKEILALLPKTDAEEADEDSEGDEGGSN